MISSFGVAQRNRNQRDMAISVGDETAATVAARLNQERRRSRKKKKPSSCCCSCCCQTGGGESKCFISISSTCYALLIVLVHVYLIKNRTEKVLTLASNIYGLQQPAYSSLISPNSSSTTTPPTVEIDLFEALRNQIDGQPDSTHGFTNSVNNGRNYNELTARLITLVLSALFLAIFLICSLQKCANYANDSVKFGRDFFAEQLHHHRKHLSRVSLVDFFYYFN